MIDDASLSGLPSELRAHVVQQVGAGAFPSAGAYIEALIRADLRRQERIGLERAIEEGLAGPAREMTKDDWTVLKQRIAARASQDA